MTWTYFASLTTTAAVIALLLGGCSVSPTGQAVIDQPLPAHLERAMASDLPPFGVGDELGWLAFGDLALAPLPAEPQDVLVIVHAEPIEYEHFDWIGQYLALAD